MKVNYTPKHASRMRPVCPKCGSQDYGIAKFIAPSGQVKYPWYCRGCGRRTTLYEPAHPHLVFEVVMDDSEENACEVCGKLGAEVHHWMPRYLAGDDCEKWPIGYLCQSCHAHWHQVIKGQPS